MKILKYIFCLLLVTQSIMAASQSDTSIWKSINFLSTTDYLNSNNELYRTHQLGFVLGYPKSVIVGQLNSKSFADVNGIQGGLNFYKKFKWGYSQLGFFYSESNIFPSSIFETSIYKKILKTAELNLGYRVMTFSDESQVSTLSIGLFYYIGDWLLSYHFTHGFSLNDGHRLMTRRYIGSPSDYIQCTAHIGRGDIRLLQVENQNSQEFLFQFLINKKVFNKLEVKGGISVKGYSSESNFMIKHPMTLGVSVSL